MSATGPAPAQRIGKYLRARLTPRAGGRTTDRWEVLANDDGVLGTVQWFGRWRQYTFDPAASTTFNANCLRDVALFLMAVNADRKMRSANLAAARKPGGENEQ